MPNAACTRTTECITRLNTIRYHLIHNWCLRSYHESRPEFLWLVNNDPLHHFGAGYLVGFKPITNLGTKSAFTRFRSHSQTHGTYNNFSMESAQMIEGRITVKQTLKTFTADFWKHFNVSAQLRRRRICTRLKRLSLTQLGGKTSMKAVCVRLWLTYNRGEKSL